MNALVLGAGLMGRAITYDLLHNTRFSKITVLDGNKETLDESNVFFSDNSTIMFHHQDVTDSSVMKSFFSNAEVVISAVPYLFNEDLTKLAISQRCHFVDLGGNNTVVQHQKRLSSQAKNQDVTIIPDSGLAPGLVSILTKSLVEKHGHFSKIKLRVGGLPQHPKKPWKYQLVFSANGLINEYVEDAIVLDHGLIHTVPSLTQCESIEFPKPFGTLEAFTTSGGCSTLPHTYKNTIDYLDYKTIRYPGHLQQIKPLFDLGLHSQKKMKINQTMITPRDVLIHLLQKKIPTKGEDVVLLKVIGEQTSKGNTKRVMFEMIDYYDKKSELSAMMRTTGFPVSITADLITTDKITKRGVFTPEEIIPTDIFLKELRKRNININKTVKTV
jgi:lysine 6-dehydrogenase